MANVSFAVNLLQSDKPVGPKGAVNARKDAGDEQRPGFSDVYKATDRENQQDRAEPKEAGTDVPPSETSDASAKRTGRDTSTEPDSFAKPSEVGEQSPEAVLGDVEEPSVVAIDGPAKAGDASAMENGKDRLLFSNAPDTSRQMLPADAPQKGTERLLDGQLVPKDSALKQAENRTQAVISSSVEDSVEAPVLDTPKQAPAALSSVKSQANAQITAAPLASARNGTDLNGSTLEKGADVRIRAEAVGEQALQTPPVISAKITAPPIVTSRQVATTPVVAKILVDSTANGKDVALSSLGEAEIAPVDAKTSSTTQTLQTSVLASAMSSAQTLRQISAQIQEAMRTMPDKPVSLSLNPEELGRVRLSISASESGIVLQVLAERPETLDLMRRHADALAKEYGALGFASVDLAFGQGTSGGSDRTDDEHVDSPEELTLVLDETGATDSIETSPIVRRADGTLSVDMRV